MTSLTGSTQQPFAPTHTRQPPLGRPPFAAAPPAFSFFPPAAPPDPAPPCSNKAATVVCGLCELAGGVVTAPRARA